MAIKNDDLLYIQRPSGVDAGGYKITAGDLLNGASGGGSSVTVDETAPLNPAEGDLWWADSDVDEGGGRLYVWTGDEWVDTSLPGGGAGEFLSKTDDDTAAGEITFEKKTEHAGGVKVTGGSLADTMCGLTSENFPNRLNFVNNSQTQLFINKYGSIISNAAINYETAPTSSNRLVDASITTERNNGETFNFRGFSFGVTDFSAPNGATAESVIGYHCSNFQSSFADGELDLAYGFKSEVSNNTNGGRQCWNFYADGTAPNYFKGLTQHAGGVSATGGTSIRAIFDTTTPNWGGNQSAKFYASGNSDQIGHQGFTANDIGPGADGNAVGFYYQENTANSTHNNYGFKANVFVNAGAGENYAFYSEGDAPSYFKGNVTSDGTIGFSGKFSLRMDTDDPSAFQTTYSTDEEGNQVENQEYIGTTEDLLSIIKDLRARVTQLEADHATMMNNNGGGY
jgi:hypothetical protein